MTTDIGYPILAEKTATFVCKPGRKTSVTKSDSDIDGEPIIHVGQDKLFPRGNCHKHGCKVCTPYDQCIKNDEDRASSKKKQKSKDNPIISEEEKALLQQLKRQQKWESSYLDVGPIGGAS
jgi:hypothetical protein